MDSPWRTSDRLLAAAILLGGIAVAYGNAFRGDFQFDDYNVIVDNPTVHTWSAWAGSMPGIRPLLKLSYTLCWTAGLGRFGFHLFNVLCHAAATLLAAALCLHLASRSKRLAPHAAAVALTAGLLFALHPAQTESVTYVSGRSMSLMGTLYLAAVVVHLRRPGRGGASPALFAAALAVRETAWTLPLALLLLERAAGVSWREAGRRIRWHVAVGLAALLAALATPGYRRLLAYSLSIRPLGENLLGQIAAHSYLLTRPLLLLQTNIDPTLTPPQQLTPGLAAQAGLLLGLLAIGLAMLRSRPWLGVGIVWTLLHLAPTNLMLPRLDLANDRQLYLALLGPAFVLAAALWALLPARAATGAMVALALVLAVATVLRHEDYRSEVALWAATAARSPGSARVWNNLGYAYRLTGDSVRARQAYRNALAIDPDHLKARYNLQALEVEQSPPRSP